jgi:hypothetical protein
LVLSRVLGQTVVQAFGAQLNRKQVYTLAFIVSLIYIGAAVGTIFAAARVDDAGKGDHKPEVQLQQLQMLSNTGTTILVVLLWPILSMLLDYLFPKSQSLSPLSGRPPSGVADEGSLAAPGTPQSTS